MNCQLLEYETVCMIGSGSFGTCFKVRNRTTGKYYVWKTIKYGTLSQEQKKRLVSEVNLMSGLHHPNIVEYHDRIIDKTSATLYIIMEWCPGGDLSVLITKCIKRNLSLDEGFIWRVLYQIARALQACHSQLPSGTLLHRDVKPANVFLDSDNNAKLGDFGLARILNSDSSCSQTFVGTPYYMSPEVIMGGTYSKKSDVWSLGCIVYELCSLRPPFKGSNIKHLAQKIIAGRFPRIPAHYSEDLQNIISLMLSSKPCDRPTVDVLIQNPVVLSHVIQDCINAKLSVPKSLQTLENPCETTEKVKVFLQNNIAAANLADVQVIPNDSFSKGFDYKFQDILSKKLEELKRKEAALQLKEFAVAERERAVQKKERDLYTATTAEGRFMTEGKSQHKYRDVKLTAWKQKTPHLYHIPMKNEDTSFSADTGDTSILPTSAKLIADAKECFIKKPNERRVHFDTVPILDAVEYTFYDRSSTLCIKKPAIGKTNEHMHSETAGCISKKNVLHRKSSAQVLQNVDNINQNNVDSSHRHVFSQWKKAGTIPRTGRGNCSNKENKHPTVSSAQNTVELPVDDVLTKKFSSVVNFR
ncbi:serine/threonine-protein kinase Nek2-like isoform X1 [Schistocerca americana]|uniref:serine/threonine-protein kinase Nek2-like isoform X1 n=2 Tax=Schistocerca americana TaxID=7009 RepID=UPI001F503E21|nr:serine/threonine-protein kinase Nek2-like isoform X1 [Schistocerca americana]